MDFHESIEKVFLLMQYKYHHPDKWVSANIDLIEETLEKKKKAVVFIAGASSSGKSYCARLLEDVLERNGHHSCILSLDNYNVGLSHLIPLKVNQNYYDGKLQHLEEISSAIKPILMEIPFDEKYSESSLLKLKSALSSYFASEEELTKFLSYLNKEWKVLNFDEPIVYDMSSAAQDVKDLLLDRMVEKKVYSKIYSERIPSHTYLNGKDYDCIIIEGIYALNNNLIRLFPREEIITNFVDGNPKSLFLRRIIRDSQAENTSASSAFTTRLYFKYIIPSYVSTILPSKENADVIYINDMTFLEKKNGTLYKTKMETHTNSKTAIDEILKESFIKKITYEKDTYFSTPNEVSPSENILRLRSYSDDKGKTYVPSSLVHKGIPKIRKDGKIIRPINILIREGDFHHVWKDESDCIQDFATAGFLIGPIQHKIKWKIEYKRQKLTIRFVEGKGYFIEFDNPDEALAMKYVNEMLEKYPQ